MEERWGLFCGYPQDRDRRKRTQAPKKVLGSKGAEDRGEMRLCPKSAVPRKQGSYKVMQIESFVLKRLHLPHCSTPGELMACARRAEKEDGFGASKR